MRAKGITLRTDNPTAAAQMAAIAALGMCIAVKDQCVSPGYACDTLFRPSIVQRLRAIGAEKKLCETMEAALEIEDVAKWVPSKLLGLLDNIIGDLTEYLKSTASLDPMERLNWTDRG